MGQSLQLVPEIHIYISAADYFECHFYLWHIVFFNRWQCVFPDENPNNSVLTLNLCTPWKNKIRGEVKKCLYPPIISLNLDQHLSNVSRVTFIWRRPSFLYFAAKGLNEQLKLQLLLDPKEVKTLIYSNVMSNYCHNSSFFVRCWVLGVSSQVTSSTVQMNRIHFVGFPHLDKWGSIEAFMSPVQPASHFSPVWPSSPIDHWFLPPVSHCSNLLHFSNYLVAFPYFPTCSPSSRPTFIPSPCFSLVNGLYF